MIYRRPVHERVAEFMRGETTRRTFREARRPFELWCRDSWADHEVVTEDDHVEVIRTILGEAHRATGMAHRMPVHLVPDPETEAGACTVAIYLDDQCIGHLAPDDADRYHGALDGIARRGFTPVVSARIWAADREVWVDDENGTGAMQQEFRSRIYLAFDEPHLLMPINSPPAARSILLPSRGTFQVHDTDAYQPTAAALIGSMGQRWAYATLHSVELASARTSREVVEARIDGARLGRLTPAMSAHVLPTIAFLSEQGITPAGRVLLIGNRRALTAKLYVTRSHDLDDRWFDLAQPYGDD